MGGSIRLDKSFTYVINFIFKANGDYKFERVESMVDLLSVYNEHNNREILELVDVNEDRETLGVAIAPDGNMQD